MRIGFIGCSGAGKSSLAYAVLEEARQKGLSIKLSSEAIASCFGVRRIRSQSLRNIFISILILPWSICGTAANFRLAALGLSSIMQSPLEVFPKLLILRSFFRVLGEYYFLRHEGRGKGNLLIDEGLVSALQMLFVHPGQRPREDSIRKFIELVPLPDLLVGIQIDRETAVMRSLRRPDPPLRNASENELRSFIAHGIQAFTFINESERLRRVLYAVSGDESVVDAAGKLVQLMLSKSAR